MRTFSISRAIRDGNLVSGPFAVRGVALAAAAFWVVVISFIAHARYDDDFRALLSLGAEPTLPHALASIPRVGPWGYDGQWYAVLSTDPLLRDGETAADLDTPSYRATRMFVPLLAFLLALGSPAAAPVLYQLLCWGLGIGAVVLIASHLVGERASPWLALLLIPTAGLAAATIRSTPDAGSLFFVLAALLAHLRGRHVLAIVLLCGAVLARETSYLVALAVAADELFHRRFVRAAVAAAVPFAAVAGWQLYLRGVLGSAFDTGSGNFSVPFSWLAEKLPRLVAGGHVWWAEIFGLLAVLATTIAFVLVAARPSRWGVLELAFLAFAGLGLGLGFPVYCETWAYARALIPIPFLAVALIPRQNGTWRRAVLVSIAGFYAVSGLAMVRSELRDARGSRSWWAALRQVSEPLQPRVLYVLPVANAGGRAGAEWRTRLEVANLAPAPTTVVVELTPAGPDAAARVPAEVTLGVGQHRVWRNAAEELFRFSGSGAIMLFPRGGPIAAQSLTANVAAGGEQGPLLPALTAGQAILPGSIGRFSGLAHDPVREAGVRTNVGFLNLRGTPTSIAIELFDPSKHTLGTFAAAVPARGFLQVDDVFARVGAPKVDGGWATVRAAAPNGAFFAYASVIRGVGAGAAYVFPDVGTPASLARR